MTASGEPDVRLAEVFGEVARSLLTERDVEQTLAKIIQLAVETIEPCEHAGIDIIGRRTIRPVVQSDETASDFGRIQVAVDEGPCLDAIREQEVFVTGRLSHERRWPAFSARAHEETGIQSVAAFRLFADEETMGALNLYSTEADAFDEHDIAVGSVFAAHAAVALTSAREREHLEEALQTRDLIGRAKGILMARQTITDDQAFDLLRRASQRLNVKLRDVAGEVIATRLPAERKPLAAVQRRPGGLDGEGDS
ncbi:MAG: GAF and ANTAR domain-containing protein [Actinobacteria bacterium]|nr:GAF and ANTAR domain-containing protein [Actinomycetota bacterium]